jgi:hypothetical protein
MKGAIVIGATVRISGPNIFERLKTEEGAWLELEENPGLEFIVQAKEGKKDSVDKVSTFIVLSDADVKIRSSAYDDEFHDSFGVEFNDKAGSHCDILFSTEQARILADIFSKFVQARDSWTGMKPEAIGCASIER